MDAVVIAGGTPAPGEPLYTYTNGRPKALLELAGKPMIQWVLDALDGAETIDRVAIAGLKDETGFHCEKLFARLENHGSIVENIRYGVAELTGDHGVSSHVAIVSSDIPAILPEHVNWVIHTANQTDRDVYYNVITRQVMESRYPGSKRSYVHLKDVEVCGGDLNVLRSSLVNQKVGLWDKIIASRKSALKQAALLGFDTLIMVMFRMLTLDAALVKVTRRLHLTGQALVCPYAEIGMDVDKPFQLDIMRRDLEQRQPIISAKI